MVMMVVLLKQQSRAPCDDLVPLFQTDGGSSLAFSLVSFPNCIEVEVGELDYIFPHIT